MIRASRLVSAAVVFGLTVAAATTAAAAVDMAVRYTVEDKPLKAAVTGTPLTFELYSDSGCFTLVQSVMLTIDDVVVSKQKLFTPPGGTKAPKVDTIEASLFPVPVGGAAYLKVTGTGITPYPSACQVQSGSAAGKVVSVTNLSGFIGVIPPATTAFVAAAPAFQLSLGQIVVASATGELGSSSGSSSFQYGICVQSVPPGPISSLSGQPLDTATADSTKRPFSTSASGSPPPGTYVIGFCVSTLGPALDTNGLQAGNIVVTQ